MAEDGRIATRPAPMTRASLLQRAAAGGVGLTAAGSWLTTEALGSRPKGAAKGGGSPKPATRGLYDRVNKIAGIVVNVSDLERSKAFWETWTPMRAYARTTTPRQAFRSLGIASGEFDGYLMRDKWEPGVLGQGQFLVHLVQWKDPAPVGVPYDSSRNSGWYRLAFNVPDTQAMYDRLVAGGVTPFAAPAFNPPPPLLPVSGFGYPDPDGITLQVIRGRPDLPDRLDHPACPTFDLQRSWRFYRDVIGLQIALRLSSCPIPNQWDRHGGSGPYEATLLRARGASPINLDIVEWGGDLPTSGRPYASPLNLGYAQVVFEVDDIEVSYDILRRLARRKGADFRLAGPPEVWDLGAAGTRRTVILHDWMGVRYQLVEAQPVHPAWDDSLPAPVCPTA
jgi:catechol 2,3-dioxygenase-like lactoylglutathione lyase family enzyme